MLNSTDSCWRGAGSEHWSGMPHRTCAVGRGGLHQPLQLSAHGASLDRSQRNCAWQLRGNEAIGNHSYHRHENGRDAEAGRIA